MFSYPSTHTQTWNKRKQKKLSKTWNIHNLMSLWILFYLIFHCCLKIKILSLHFFLHIEAIFFITYSSHWWQSDSIFGDSFFSTCVAIKRYLKGGEMALWVMVFATKPENMNSIPRTPTVKGENWLLHSF